MRADIHGGPEHSTLQSEILWGETGVQLVGSAPVKPEGICPMVQTPEPQPSYSVADFERTLIFALEVSDKSWVVAAHVPGLPGSKPRRTLLPSTDALLEMVDHYRARAAKADKSVDRVVLVYEVG